MRALTIAIATLSCSCAYAASAIGAVQLEGISVPFFDPAGRPTHKLTAKSGTLRGDERLLQEAEIVYFAPDSSDRVIQRITAAEAVYSETKQTLTGSGPVRVITELNQLSGTGFDFSLSSSVLNVHRDVRMEDAEFIVTCDRATADLVIERSGRKMDYRGIRSARFIDNLHFIAVKPAKGFHIEEAFTDLAVYDGITRAITMPNEVREIGRDDKGRRVESTSKRATITLTGADRVR